MNVDLDFLRETYNARLDIGKWLNERPKVGLDVTDIATLVDGYDYLIKIVKDITGEDLLQNVPTQVEDKNSPSVQITFLD
jgi:hypothetical protein